MRGFAFNKKGCDWMKKLNVIANILICLSLGLLVIRALLSYNNYMRHVELFNANGWFWYTDVLEWGKYILPIVGLCVIVKFILRKK